MLGLEATHWYGIATLLGLAGLAWQMIQVGNRASAVAAALSRRSAVDLARDTAAFQDHLLWLETAAARGEVEWVRRELHLLEEKASRLRGLLDPNDSLQATLGQNLRTFIALSASSAAAMTGAEATEPADALTYLTKFAHADLRAAIDDVVSVAYTKVK